MATSPRRLPVQPTPLVGRQREVQAVCGLLARDDIRLVTLTGPGGTGKTRLGLEVAASLRGRVVDEIAFVDLAALDDPTLLIPSIAECVGVRGTGRRPLPDVLVQHLDERRLLLLLDSFDRIVSSATAVADLLGACPSLRILVTSRAPLRLRGEHDYPVPPLALPEPGAQHTAHEVSTVSSVVLFVQRVSDLDPDFALTDANAPTVAEICRRLDGLPLAIELAAARAKLLSPEAMLDRLDRRLALLTGGPRDLPDRHRTLRAAIAWSHDLLDRDSQRLFRRLSIFVGGCTLKAAEAIDSGADRAAPKATGTSASEIGVQPACLDLVGSLVDGSLLQRRDGVGGEPRYAMLDTIREYGLERLALEGEDVAVRRRHLAWCTAFAEYAETQVRGPTGPVWLDRLTAELDNVRAALAWSLADLEETSARQGLRLAGAYLPVWYFRDHLDEGRRWLGRCLAADLERSPRAESVPHGTNAGIATAPRPDDQEGWWFAIDPRVKALIALCNLCQQLGDLREAETAIVEAIAVAQRIHDALGEARAMTWLAIVVRSSGDYVRAVSLFEDSLSTFRQLDHAFGVWWALNQLGETIMRVGEYERARRLGEECVELAQRIGSLWGIADSRHRLGMVIFRQGELDRARTLLEESLAGYIALRAHGLHTCLLDLGTIALARGDLVGAAEYFARSLTRCHEIGDRYNTARSLEGLAQTIAVLGASDDDALSLAAAQVLGAAVSLRDEIGFTVAPVDRPALEQAEAALRARLGGAAVEAARFQGRSRASAQAVEHALVLVAQVRATASTATSGAEQSTSRPLAPESPLTAREYEVALLMASGLSNRQIATSLVISERTVHTHVARVLAKLGFRSRAQVAAWVVRHGLNGSTNG